MVTLYLGENTAHSIDNGSLPWKILQGSPCLSVFLISRLAALGVKTGGSSDKVPNFFTPQLTPARVSPRAWP